MIPELVRAALVMWSYGMPIELIAQGLQCDVKYIQNQMGAQLRAQRRKKRVKP